jgi:hypothetical protein
MNKNLLRQLINVLAVIATLTLNILANALPLNGLATGEISDRFQVYFVPAGYVFSIWGLIYIGLIAFAVYQALPAQRENPRLLKIGYLPAWSGLANMAWLVLWHWEQFALTPIAMLLLLGLLITIYLRLDTGRVKIRALERWCVDIPFSVYLGWVSVATIANLTQVLDFLGWSGFGISDLNWAVIMLFVAAILGWVVAVTRRDVAFLLVFVWALTGIAGKQAAYPLVASAAWVSAGLVLAAVVYSIFMQVRQRGEQK